MNFEKFINQKITTLKNEIGVVTSFDENHIVIDLGTTQKTFKPELAFSSNYLKFQSEELNSLIKEFLSELKEKENEAQIEVQKSHDKHVYLHKKARSFYIYLENKEHYLKKFFGYDFVYPKLEVFKKEYKYYIHQYSPFRKYF